MKTKRGRPRKPVAEQLTERIEVRASVDEKRRLEVAANLAGLKLSDWIREALARAAGRAVKSKSGPAGS
jgi:uncharacterized protein (DUF1778 family)